MTTRKPTSARRWRLGCFCSRCRQTLRRHHRWHIEGCVVAHDDCDNPTLSDHPQPPLLAGQSQPPTPAPSQEASA